MILYGLVIQRHFFSSMDYNRAPQLRAAAGAAATPAPARLSARSLASLSGGMAGDHSANSDVDH